MSARRLDRVVQMRALAHDAALRALGELRREAAALDALGRRLGALIEGYDEPPGETEGATLHARLGQRARLDTMRAGAGERAARLARQIDDAVGASALTRARHDAAHRIVGARASSAEAARERRSLEAQPQLARDLLGVSRRGTQA